MKVKELRDQLKAKDPKLVEDAFVEAYKLLPKSKKEEADDIIADILSGQGKQKKAKTEAIDFPQLLKEIGYFISCVKEGYYLSPNQVISKAERPKWRFKVKNYIKALLACPLEDPIYPEVVEFLISIYELLCEGCGVYLFNSDNPFQSVGIGQPDLFGTILKKMEPLGINDKAIKRMIQLAVDVDISPDNLHIELIDRLLCFLKSDEQRTSLLVIAKEMRESQYMKIKQYKERYNIPYRQKSFLELLNQLVFITLSLRGITTKDVDEYLAYSRDHQEVALYCMLDVISSFGADEDWIDVYRYAVTTKKIKPRESLETEYKQLLEELKSQ